MEARNQAAQTCIPEDSFAPGQNLQPFTCQIGLGVFNDPVMDSCGHTFCRKCIEDCLKKSPLCPLSRQPLNNRQLVPNLTIKEMIENLRLQCPHGCDFQGSKSDLKQHLASGTCVMMKILCPLGCGTLISNAFRTVHETEACPYAFIDCPYARETGCNERVRRIDGEKHLNENARKHLDSAVLKLRELQDEESDEEEGKIDNSEVHSQPSDGGRGGGRGERRGRGRWGGRGHGGRGRGRGRGHHHHHQHLQYMNDVEGVPIPGYQPGQPQPVAYGGQIVNSMYHGPPQMNQQQQPQQQQYPHYGHRGGRGGHKKWVDGQGQTE